MSGGTWDTHTALQNFAYGAITLYGRPFQTAPLSLIVRYLSPATPDEISSTRFRLFPFRSPLLRESLLISLPKGTEMFHFPSFASPAYVFSRRWHGFTVPGFPIRKSPDQSLFAAPRGLSQLTTSFIASQCQGIHRAPLVA